jgi:hypothetical protein
MIFESDVFLLKQFLFPENDHVFILDPSNKIVKNHKSNMQYVQSRSEIQALKALKHTQVIINNSGADTFKFPLNFAKVDGIISFNPFQETSIDFYHIDLFATLGQQHSIQWIISEDHRNTDFLEPEKAYTVKTNFVNLLSVFPELMQSYRVRTGKLKKATNLRIQVLKKEKNLFDLQFPIDYQSFAINLEKSYQNNIISIHFYKSGSIIHQLRFPAGKMAQQDIRTELKTMDVLKKMEFKKLILPQIRKERTCNSISIDPQQNKNSYYSLLYKNWDVFCSTLLEYYQNTLGKEQMGTLLSRLSLIQKIAQLKLLLDRKKIPRGLSSVNLIRLLNLLAKIINNTEKNVELSTCLNNCSLDPAYIFTEENKMTISNWTLSKEKFPLFYDILNFLFEYFENAANPEPEKLASFMHAFSQQEKVASFIAYHQLSFDLYLKLFLVIRLPLEIEKMFAKSRVLPESNLKIYLWLELLEHYPLEI